MRAAIGGIWKCFECFNLGKSFARISNNHNNPRINLYASDGISMVRQHLDPQSAQNVDYFDG